jgi:hypothetical protein
MVLAAATALVAQDAELTPEQIAKKCADEGGCALFTFQEFEAIIRAEKAISYQQGLRACNSNI